MDLNEHAEQALRQILRETGAHLDREAETIARMMWLDGCGVGMNEIQKLAAEVRASLQAGLA